jgi:hypothetical protein
VAAKKRSGTANGTGAGRGVDSSGGPVVDPTQNVMDLSEASNKRQDDLRIYTDLITQEKFRRIDDLRVAESRRLDDLRLAESKRIDGELILRAFYEDKLNAAEASRINAIRAVDVGAVAVASERATQQAAVLANQVIASADALRSQLAATAATMATQLQGQTTQITDRLALVEKAQYENKGRQGLADPQMENLIIEMRKLTDANASGMGKSAGLNQAWAILIGAAIIAGTIAAFMYHTH